MKLHNVKTGENGVITVLPDAQGLETKIENYIKWLKGEPIDNPGFSKKLLEKFSGPLSKYKINDNLMIEGDCDESRIWFDLYHTSKLQKELDEYYIFIDLDTKWLLNNNITDEQTVDQVCSNIIDQISFDEELKDKVFLAYRSGTASKNGLHIILKVDQFLTIKQKESKLRNLLRYLQTNTQVNLFFNKEYFSNTSYIDLTSLRNKTSIKWNTLNSVKHWINEKAIWSDFNWNKEPDKLEISDTYESGTHDRLYQYLCRTSKSLEEIILLYKDDLMKPADRSGKTIEEEINRLYKYVEKFSWREEKEKVQSYQIFYTENNKIKVDENKLYDLINSKYDIILKDDLAYIREKTSNESHEFFYHNKNKIWSFIPYILDDLGIKNQTDRNLLTSPITNIIRNRTFTGEPPKRDLDTHDSIIYLFKFKDGEVKQLRVTKSGYFLEKPNLYLADTEVNIPILSEDLNLNIDWKNWDVMQQNFFKNIIKGYKKLPELIGFTQCLYTGHNNSGRMVVFTDGINDEEDQSGTGKSVLLMFLRYLRRYVNYNTFDPKASFEMEKLQTTTQIITVDELDKNQELFLFRQFYSPDGIAVKKKFRSELRIPPVKLLMASNYRIKGDKADMQRIIKIGIERYYERTKNPFNKHLGYKVFNDEILSGKDFINDHGQKIIVKDWWSYYIKFMISCSQRYLNNHEDWINDHMSLEKSSKLEHNMYLEGKHRNLYEEVIINLNSIINQNKGSQTVDIKNIDLCNHRIYSNNNLGMIKHLIKTYLEYNVDLGYEYDSKITINERLGHRIKIKQ